MPKTKKSSKEKQPRAARNADEPLNIWYLLDRSGSMQPLQEAVVHQTNTLLTEQRGGNDECRITIAQFDSQDPFEVIVDDEAIGDVKPLVAADYEPRGATPLYDAIGALVGRADRRIRERKAAGLAEEDQMVVIFTDGLENASTDYDRAGVMKLLDERQEQGWTIAYLGANQDSYAQSRQLGVDPRSASNFNASEAGIASANRSVSRGIASRRAMSRAARRRENRDFFQGVREGEQSE